MASIKTYMSKKIGFNTTAINAGQQLVARKKWILVTIKFYWFILSKYDYWNIRLYKACDKPDYKITFIVSAAVVYCGSPIRSSSSAVVVKHPNDLHVTSYLPAAQTTEEYADILDDSEYSIICMN